MKMASSGMLRRVALVRTDVSEELSTSFIRVTRIGELGITLAVPSNRRTLRVYCLLQTLHFASPEFVVCRFVFSDYKQKQTNSVALSPRANYTD
jgi:hypothetical protein